MAITIDAVFEKGVFRPVSPPEAKFPEGVRVRLAVETERTPEEILELAGNVYAGLSEDEIEEIEEIILDRSNFFGDRSELPE